MKRTSSTVYSVCIILAIVSSVGIAGLIHNRTRGQKTAGEANSLVSLSEKTKIRRACTPSVEPTSDGKGTASYNGVSFSYHLSLASQVDFETKPESPLTGETDKPEGVVPAHTAFTFKGSYGLRHKSSFFKPEISIYPIQKYKEALALSTAYVQSLERDIVSLKAILDERPASLEREVPFLPFGTDANQAFVSRVRYIDFKNGKGLMFLTQFNTEPSLVNNQGLTYIFQGLTDDGLYYVSARFPVTASFLPSGYESKSFGKYSVSMFYGSDQKQMNYKLYLETIKRKLVDVPAETFEPNLTSIDNLISSLCVEPK